RSGLSFIGALLHRRQIFDWKHHALVLISYVKNLRNRRSLLVPLRGFTLAEVLITLGIIGVVAAMTIPTLMQNSQNRELVSQYLKMNNVLSNALKNMEAYEQTKINKMNETDFKTKFENHLKTITCNSTIDFTPDVCLTDGGQIKYGTFDSNCPNDICETLTIDTNGDKKPNEAGKDRFTVNLTKLGLRATGESDTCENGLDCGAYILAHHKLWSGEIANNIPTLVIPDGCEDAECSSCTDSTFFKPSGGACVTKSNTELLSECKSSGTSNCIIKTSDGKEKNMTKITINVDGENTPREIYVSERIKEPQKNMTWNDVISLCPENTRIPTINELLAISKQRGVGNIPALGYFWSSNKYNEEYAFGVNFDTETSSYIGYGDNSQVLCIDDN
ncbi:prepilin-type N-terminal cleavage/methylation domain-containing protein, partial [bacterium]|nr:prepilin-type N-terminal cleavage/methylation domain-containing protein [bacterium]